MKVLKINNYNNCTFARRLTPEEEIDYRKNALQPALNYLGVKELSMIMHGTSFPQSEYDAGCGSPYNEKALEVIKFDKLHGFNSIQLGPVGAIRNPLEVSPYKSTVFTKNYLFIDFEKLSSNEYAGILQKDTLTNLLGKSLKDGENYAYSDFFDAFENSKYLINIANRNFKAKLSENDVYALKLNGEFLEFKKQKGKQLMHEALFYVLSDAYDSQDFNQWEEIDKDLISQMAKHNPQAISRYRKIVTRSKNDIENYIFAQFILDKQVKENTLSRQKMDFKYINDLLVGFSPADEWANRSLFLKDFRMGCPNGGAYGPQLWDIPVLNPKKLFKSDGSLGPAGLFLKKKLDTALEDFDNVRIDHALGLIDPYIYDKNSVEIVNGRIDLSKFRADNVSNIPEIDPNGNFKKVLNEIVLPVLKSHGIDKNSPVWEDLGSSTHVFDEIYRKQNRIPGITQLEWMRGENYRNTKNWALVGSHDSDPANIMIEKEWVRNSDAWNPLYLAGFLNSNPDRAYERDEYCRKISISDIERVKAKFAELFLTSDKIQISFADFFGIDKTYNKGGEELPQNWKLRLNRDFEQSYYENLSSENPTAINMPEVLKIAVQAKSDLNSLRRNNSANIQKAAGIMSNLEKYENILKEKE